MNYEHVFFFIHDSRINHIKIGLNVNALLYQSEGFCFLHEFIMEMWLIGFPRGKRIS